MWFIIALIVILLIFLIWWLQRPLYYRGVKSEEFEKYLRGFMSQCADGSLMFIEHERSVRFVQFAKYRLDNSRAIIHFGFPDAPWSRQYFDNMIERFQTLGINFDITTGEGQVHRFLKIELAIDDPERIAPVSARIAKVAFESMGLTESATFRIYYRGKLSADAVIPSLETLSEREGPIIRRLSRYFLRKLSNKKRRTKQ